MSDLPKSPIERLMKESNSLGVLRADDPLSDFRKFLYVVWKHLGLPDPTPVQYDIAHFLQHGPRRAVIEAFRGVGKSWITSAFACWLLYENAQLKILVTSASKVRADDFTTFTLRLINEMPILQHLAPRNDQRNSKVSFDVGPATPDHAPSVKSIGISGQIAGSRADVIIPDDIEVPNNSATQMMREKLAEAVKEFDAVLKPGGLIRYLGTPQTEMSLYNALPNRGYTVRIWPARFPDEDQAKRYGNRLAPRIAKVLQSNPTLAGKPTDSMRFNDGDLMEREASYGRSGFSLQFMLDTSLSDANKYPLKVRDLVVMDLNTELAPEQVIWASGAETALNDLPCVAMDGDRFHKPMALVGKFIPYAGSVMVIDPSGRGKDETSYSVVKQLNGYLFNTAGGAVTGGYDPESLKALVEIAKQQKVNRVLIEANFGDGMFTALIKPYFQQAGYPVTIEEVKHSIQKEKRIIDTLEPVMNQHKLIVDRALIERDYKSTQSMPAEEALKYQMIYQMTRITRLKGALAHDDRLDALAMAVAYWVNAMAQNTNDRIAERRDEMFRKEFDMFMKLEGLGLAVALGHQGGPSRGGTWMKTRR
jgi:hypothetical protein